MVRILQKLNQRAVYWSVKGVDDRGDYTYNDPEEIPCRWQDKKTVKRDRQGTLIEFSSQVMVYQTLDEGGMLLLGLISQLTEPTPPPTTARQIVMFEDTPTVQNIGPSFKQALL